MSITRNDILKGETLPKEYEHNILILLERVNKLQALIPSHKFHITSGFRTLQHHLAIYKAKGITDQSKIPMKSKHLTCEAVDIQDKDNTLKPIVEANDYKFLRECNLVMENSDNTIGWLHVQIVPVKSGKIEFNP